MTYPYDNQQTVRSTRHAASGTESGARPPGGSGRSGDSGGSGPVRPTGRGRWRTVRRVAYVFVALALIIPIVTFLVAYSTVHVPDPGEIKTNQVATLLTADGTSVLATVVPPEGNRTDVAIDQIPVHVRNAVLSAEDRDFYSNPGFSVSGFARAARDNVMGKDTAGGGSTITQQYVKNALVGDEHSIQRKMHELVISSKMARQWSKDDILAAYLNTIYFGRGTYGIAAASKAYFGKPIGELSVAEGAVLAASIQQPSLLDPEINPEGAQSRWSYVLDGMVSSGTLPAGERATMQYPPVVPVDQANASQSGGGPEGLIKNQVLRELSEAGISEQQLNTEGLQITTTIDAKAQKSAVDAVNKNMEGEPEQLRTAVVSVDPRTGAVRAYYGGGNGNGYDFANAGLQTGSSFKVFALAANLDQDRPLSKMYDSSPLTLNGITITNVEGESCGTCTIAEALKRSLNTSFYRLEQGLDHGARDIADIAHKAGIPAEIPGVGPSLTEPDGSGPNDGIVLGQYQSRPLDMASAYATLAASGMYHKPHFVQKVATADGRVLLDYGASPGEQTIEKAVADNVTAAMRPIAGYSRGHNLADGRASASKTGTAQLGDTGENKDAWMVGYTPSLSTAVWVGTEQGLPLRNSYGSPIYGSALPSDIWKDTMDGALDGTDNENFPTPAPIAGQAGIPAYTAPAPVAPRTTTTTQRPLLELPELPLAIEPSQIEIAPGVTIPVPRLVPSQPQRGTPQDTAPPAAVTTVPESEDGPAAGDDREASPQTTEQAVPAPRGGAADRSPYTR